VIPFNRPTIAPNQLKYVQESFHSAHLAGDGEFTRRASNLLSDLHIGAKALLTTSCTAALEMAAVLLDLQPGDEVIVPSYTFVSSANAFAMMGARVIFADIDRQTLCVDPHDVARLISHRTKAVVAVNYGGFPSVDDFLIELCSLNHLTLIEDNAHGLFGLDSTKPLGTRSAMSTLSFHETKNVTCGEGGALIINDIDRFLERAEIIREKGTNRSRFFRGMVDKYTWIDKGSSYLLSDINAAVLLAQLEFRDEIQRRRQHAYQFFQKNLSSWAFGAGFQLPHNELVGHSPYHLFPILAPTPEIRQRFLDHTRSAGVACTFHYLPLHLSPAGRRFGNCDSDAPNTVFISDHLVRIPLFSDITEEEIINIVEIVSAFK
jgi:dTDP-4-amino-4,6-dideoxygalactose transaminase